MRSTLHNSPINIPQAPGDTRAKPSRPPLLGRTRPSSARFSANKPLGSEQAKAPSSADSAACNPATAPAPAATIKDVMNCTSTTRNMIRTIRGYAMVTRHALPSVLQQAPNLPKA